ncbi:MAG: mRNA splicing protein [Chrysothrix sp. TS-e1954]|nr:MAG: mRNA splicing protein [Chrysothrix sp. TS-e1954]
MPSNIISSRKPADISAQKDTERNQYIPSFISKKPFYVDDKDSPASTSDADYLEHQRLHDSSARAPSAQQWYDRGRKLGPAATKFRKGACENCGAMTHKTKECLSRPRKQGAKWTGVDIQADEVVQDVKLGWDAKRDRWNGYDAREYKAVVEEHQALEELKRKVDGEGKEEEDGDDAGAKYEEETDMGRQQSTSTRNLRLREDTAKYLLNLDLESARYDPKTRSMVDSGATADQAAALVAEEGFMKMSGDAGEFEKAQRAAWEAQERGDSSKLHLQANPTAAQITQRKEKDESETKKQQQRKMLLDMYGEQTAHAQKDDDALRVQESQRFVEYDERGLLKGAPKTKAKSQYPEDVMINNHTSVWGSWWKSFQWGYRCCHSTVKNSYCTGEEGIRAQEEAERMARIDDGEDGAEEEAKLVEEVPKQIAWQEEAEKEEHVPNGVKGDAKARKRTLQEMRNDANEQELEDYQRKKVSTNDPMRQHLGKDQLVS